MMTMLFSSSVNLTLLLLAGELFDQFGGDPELCVLNGNHCVGGECGACCHVLNYLLACVPSSVCAELPLPSASVDAVVCDLPFGRKFGTKTNMAANLPLILTEMERFVPLCVCFHCLFQKCSLNQKMVLVFFCAHV